MRGKHHNVVPGAICEKDLCKIKEAVCVQVEKVYDSCGEKDCIENARVILKGKCANKILKKAINVKVRKAEVVDVYADIEEVPFKRGFYTVDVKFFIIVTLDFFVPACGTTTGTRIITRKGLVLFDKKVVLFGSEGGVKIFKSHYVGNGIDTPIRTRLQQDNLPISKVEVAEPLALSAKIEEIFDRRHDMCNCREQIPEGLIDILENDGHDFMEETDVSEEDMGRDHNRSVNKRVVVSLGLFSIIKLVRYVQLLIPAFDFCIPHKECIAATEENPCDLFDSIEFPFDEFFPPQKMDFPGALETEKKMHHEYFEQDD
jgi:hypothetical protein